MGAAERGGVIAFRQRRDGNPFALAQAGREQVFGAEREEYPLVVDHAEAAARLAPGQVERWQAVSLAGYSPSDASDPAPRGWEPVSAWEPVANHEGHILWKRPLRRVKP